MADIISLLPDHVANQIAAGEVIQRPASVVKELLENAVDAKATQIQLIIKDAGKTLIQVVDNGMGMSVTDVRMAFERHATSKIKVAEDLFSLSSKGFRGEALASIAAIAHVETHTRRVGDEVATSLIIEGSKVINQELSVAPKGTSIAIKNLFFNIPARRNFLKSNNIELRHIVDEFRRVALAHPDIQFTFFQNDTELFTLPKTNLKKRIVNIFGGRIDEKLIPVNEKTTVALVEGFVTKPDYAKKSRGQQFFFINQRYVRSPFLHHSVISSFEGLLPPNHYPGYFLYLQLNPKAIDINIHPTKTEVKFEDEQSLYAILKSSIKHSLGMFQVVPTLDFERTPSNDVPYNYKNKVPSVPTIKVDASFNPFKGENKPEREKSVEGWDNFYTGLSDSVVKIQSAEADSLIEGITNTPRVFQLFSKYIVCALRSSLLIIDQNRAHQRILYERFLTTITTTKAPSQQLMFPVSVSVDFQQKQIFEESKEILESLGFQISPDENDRLTVSGAPENCAESQISEVLENVLTTNEFDSGLKNLSHADTVAKALAKSLAIKQGKNLNIKEQQCLLDDLFGCKETLVSPFNRQIFITLKIDEIEKKMN